MVTAAETPTIRRRDVLIVLTEVTLLVAPPARKTIDATARAG